MVRTLVELGRLAKRVEQEIRSTPGIVDLRSSVRRGNPEVLVTLDRERLAEHNLMLADVANRLRIAVEGEVSSTFPGKDDPHRHPSAGRLVATGACRTAARCLRQPCRRASVAAGCRRVVRNRGWPE